MDHEYRLKIKGKKMTFLHYTLYLSGTMRIKAEQRHTVPDYIQPLL
jgi:hypothetical protein